LIHRGFIPGGYDGGRNVRDEEELSVGRKKPEPEQKEEPKQSRWGFRGMTVRDWLELLIVPMVLVGIGLLFEMRQADRQEATEKQQQELAEQRAQDEALQAYLNQMSQLMLERKLLETEPGTPLYTLAQARTSTVILRLDAEHNASVIRFLSDSGLAWSKAGSVTTFAIAPDSGARRLPPSVFL
jgi:type II secretory pathway pseudopilin PulG